MAARIDNLEILMSDLKTLPVSENFYLRSKLMGFEKLQDIFDTPVQQMLNRTDFTYSWLGELITLLKSRKLLYKLQPMPGSIAY